jgi:putative ABC transport system permease protein
VGLASFGDEDSLAGATLAVFELTEAQRFMGMEGGYTTIDIEAVGGIDPGELAARVQPVLQGELEAVTGAQQTQEQVDEMAAGLGFINVALLAFAGVAIFVGAFIIQNTFRIIVAQRTRELALMRAIGATGRQIVSMVVLEAFAVALVASAAGVLGGVGLSALLKAGMDSLGFGMPEGPLTVLPRTVIVAMAVGVIVTLASALIPAIAAARVAPVAAIRTSGAPSRRPLGRRAVAGTIVSGAGGSLLAFGLFGNSVGSMAFVATGALVLFLGVSVLTPLLVRPISAVVGWPIRLLGGITGRLAQENTGRQPRRTAATASALMIGIALVAFVSIFAASVKASVADTMEEAFPADLAVHSTIFGGADIGVSPMIGERLAELDELQAVSAMQAGTIRVEGVERSIAAIDPATIESVYSLGAVNPPADLGSGLFVLDTQLDEQGWSVGDLVAVEFALTGPTSMEIEGSFTDDSVASFLITTDTYRENFGSPLDSAVFARVADGVALSDAEAAVEAATADFATIDVQTKSELIASAEAEVNTMVVLFQGLLGLAIVIAVLGIANTLALSIVERTRELGLLRALGMGRRQVRRMVRWEAVFIGFLGALLGIGVGSFLGWAVVEALAEDGLNTLLLPGAELAVYVVLGAIAGVVAAIGPARKAARLDVLDAISYE